MADIEVVIKLDEEYIKQIDKIRFLIGGIEDRSLQINVINAIKNGTPLPKGHGDLIDRKELKENINGWYAFMKDVCKQPYMTLKQEEIIGKIDIMTPIIEADKEQKDGTNE